MRKIFLHTWIALSLSMLVLSHSGVFAAWEDELSCEYVSDFERCVSANKNGTTRSIKDFVCLQSNNNEAILDQVILDKKFKEIDEEILQYLKSLEADKEFAAKQTNRAVDDITKNFWWEWSYFKRYKDLCNHWILEERAKCWDAIPNLTVWDRIKWSYAGRECIKLVEHKLDVYTKVADSTLKINKAKVQQDNHKKYIQEERKKFDALLNDQITIVGHIGRLARWVTHWTPNPLQAVLFKGIFNNFI